MTESAYNLAVYLGHQFDREYGKRGLGAWLARMDIRELHSALCAEKLAAEAAA
jgi:hypothetical protein